MDRRKASKAPLVQAPLSPFPARPTGILKGGGNLAAPQPFPPTPDTGRRQTQASRTCAGTFNKHSSQPASFTATSSHLRHHCCCLHLYTAFHCSVLCTPRSPPLHHRQHLLYHTASPLGLHPPNPASAVAAAPQTQAEHAGPLRLWPRCM